MLRIVFFPLQNCIWSLLNFFSLILKGFSLHHMNLRDTAFKTAIDVALYVDAVNVKIRVYVELK